MKILNLTQHVATKEQENDGVVEPSKELKERIKPMITFEDIPTKKEMTEVAKELVKFVKEYDCEGAMIGGAMFFMSTLENALKQENLTPYYAFSKRRCEEKLVDGVVKKISLFEYIGLIEM